MPDPMDKYFDEKKEVYVVPATELLFCAIEDEDGIVNVYLTPREYWEHEECAFDQHILIEPPLSDDWMDVMECCYNHDNQDTTVAEANEYFTSIGMVQSAEFSAFMKEHTDPIDDGTNMAGDGEDETDDSDSGFNVDA